MVVEPAADSAEPEDPDFGVAGASTTAARKTVRCWSTFGPAVRRNSAASGYPAVSPSPSFNDAILRDAILDNTILDNTILDDTSGARRDQACPQAQAEGR